MPDLHSFGRRRWVQVGAVCGALAGLLGSAAVPAVTSKPDGVKPAVSNSELDAPLFYQLLLGELELRSGNPGTAYQVMLDAARRTHDEQLFRRAVEIALQARAGDQALQAVKAWRSALPQSTEALRFQVQLLMALNRPADAIEPLGALLQATPPGERSGLISSLPRLLQRAPDARQAAAQMDKLLQPYLQADATRTAARVALGRLWLAAKDDARATALLELARKDDPDAPGPVLLALEMMPTVPSAETAVTRYLAQPKAEPMVRLAYARALTASQRYADAVPQLEHLTRERPDLAAAWLTLGALQLELRQPRQAEAALQHYVGLAQPAAAPGAASAPASAASAEAADDSDSDEGEADEAARPGVIALSRPSDSGLMQAWLMLSQAAEMQGDYKAAEAWLARVDNPQRALEVQTRRAALLARQGRVKEGLALVRKVPERSPEDARAKLLAESQVLRDVKHWREARDVLAQANDRFPDDADLLYEQAMVEEKLDDLAAMERLLRRVIELKPDNQQAYNALGYSLADRNQRLPEAKALIEKALQLAPGEPFITDSLAWVEYRMGHGQRALQLLRQAYRARPDVEIAAHLGEVLWTEGQRDEARKVLRDARRRDADNDVLNETIARLKVDL